MCTEVGRMQRRLFGRVNLCSVDNNCIILYFTDNRSCSMRPCDLNLGVTFDNLLNVDRHISNVCSFSYFHILFATFVLILILELINLCYCWFQAGLCQLSSHWHFCAQYSSPSARSKFLGASCNSLNNQLHLSTKFAALASDSATNWL